MSADCIRYTPKPISQDLCARVLAIKMFEQEESPTKKEVDQRFGMSYKSLR